MLSALTRIDSIGSKFRGIAHALGAVEAAAFGVLVNLTCGTCDVLMEVFIVVWTSLLNDVNSCLSCIISCLQVRYLILLYSMYRIKKVKKLTTGRVLFNSLRESK